LHSDKSEHALNLAKSKLEKIILDTRLIIRGIYKGKVISLYKNGKIAIKDVDRKEAEYILKDLLS
jgi:ArsR family metal-binding transcriptional regulator